MRFHVSKRISDWFMGCLQCKCCGCYPSSLHRDFKLRRGRRGRNRLGKQIVTQRPLELISVSSHNFNMQYSVLSQRGYYPDSPDKENQDSFCISTQLQGDPNIHFFGVFDGHGLFGTGCSDFVKSRLVEVLSDDPDLKTDPIKAYNSAFLRVNSELRTSGIDDSMSGTTAITVLLVGDTLYVANVGDSRAVIAVANEDEISAEDLSHDQTPFRTDECERVKRCGARVLSVDQVEGLKDPNVQTWGDEETEGSDPPRLWVQNGMYPGTAFTRSVGDSLAEKIGVIPVPEVSVVQLTPAHLFFIIASDGVFEFLSSQTVVDMAAKYADPREACKVIAGESYRKWLQNESRTDDITIITVQIKDFTNSGPSADGEEGRNMAPKSGDAASSLTGL